MTEEEHTPLPNLGHSYPYSLPSLVQTIGDEPVRDVTLPLTGGRDYECLFSVRTKRVLLRENVTTLKKLLSLSEADLLDFKGFGQQCLGEVREYVEQMGLSLPSQHHANARSNLLPPISVQERIEIAGYRSVADLRRLPFSKVFAGGSPFFLSPRESEQLANYLYVRNLMPYPEDPDEVVLLLSLSALAREALEDPPNPADKHRVVHDQKLRKLLEVVEPEIEHGGLHPEVLLDWASIGLIVGEPSTAIPSLVPSTNASTRKSGRLVDTSDLRHVLEMACRIRDLSPQIMSPKDLDSARESVVSSSGRSPHSLLGDLEDLINFSRIKPHHLELVLARYGPGRRPLLQNLGEHYDVSRARIGRIQLVAADKLAEAFSIFPLPRFRSGLLFVRELLPAPRGKGRQPKYGESLIHQIHRRLQNTSSLATSPEVTQQMVTLYSAIAHAGARRQRAETNAGDEKNVE